MPRAPETLLSTRRADFNPSSPEGAFAGGCEQPGSFLFAGEHGLPFTALSGATGSRPALPIHKGARDQCPPFGRPGWNLPSSVPSFSPSSVNAL